MHTLHRTKVESKLRECKGFFSVVFTKQDGSVRSMLCVIPRPVENPKRSSPAKENNSYILVRDMIVYKKLYQSSGKLAAQKGSYRLINLDTMIKVKISGITYIIN